MFTPLIPAFGSRDRQSSRFEDNLVYIASSRMANTIASPSHKNKQTNKKTNNHSSLAQELRNCQASVNHRTRDEEGEESSKWHVGATPRPRLRSAIIWPLSHPPGCHLRCLTGGKRRTLCASHGKPKWWHGDQQPNHQPAEQRLSSDRDK